MSDKNGQSNPLATNPAQQLRVTQIQAVAQGIVPSLNDVVNAMLAELGKSGVACYQEGMLVALLSVICGRAKTGGVPLPNLTRELATVYAATQVMPLPPDGVAGRD